MSTPICMDPITGDVITDDMLEADNALAWGIIARVATNAVRCGALVDLSLLTVLGMAEIIHRNVEMLATPPAEPSPATS